MTATAHALVGTMIAARFSDPSISLPLAPVLHYALDLVPHWDSGTHLREKSNTRFVKEAIVDAGIAFVVSGLVYFYLFQRSDFIYLYLVVGFSLLPDIVTVVTRFILKKKNKVWDWNNRLQSMLNRRLELPWGLFTQIIVLGVLYILLFTVFV